MHAVCLYSNIQGQVQLGQACHIAQAGGTGFVCMQPWLSTFNDDDGIVAVDDDDDGDKGVEYALHHA